MFQQNKKKSNKNEHLANKGKLKNSLQKKKIVPRGKPGCNPEYDMYNKIQKK